MGETDHSKSDCILCVIHGTCAHVQSAEEGHLARHTSWGSGSYVDKSLPRTVGRTLRKEG